MKIRARKALPPAPPPKQAGLPSPPVVVRQVLEAPPTVHRGLDGTAAGPQHVPTRVDPFALRRAGADRETVMKASGERRALLNQVLNPPPIEVAGKPYDFGGVDAEGRVQLQPRGNTERFVDTASLGGATTLDDDAGRWSVTQTVGAISRLEREVEPLPPPVPLEQLGSPPIVRLKGSERDGLYALTRTEDGQLAVTSVTGPPVLTPITPEELSPRFATVYSSTFGTLKLDSAVIAYSQEKTGKITSGTDPRIGALPVGTSHIRVMRGDAVLADLTKQIRAGKGPLSVVMYATDEASPTSRGFVDALLERRRQLNDAGAPTEVMVMGNARTPIAPALERELLEAGVMVHGNTDSGRQRIVNHRKTVVQPGFALITTGAAIGASENKVEASGTLPPAATELFAQYQTLLWNQGSRLKRGDLVEQLASHGVLLNDPESHSLFVARAIHGLVEGAQQRLEIFTNELQDLESVEAILERARNGVTVDLWVRENLDPRARELIESAVAADPSLKVSLHLFRRGPEPYLHTNVIVSDDRAYMGTSFLWSNHLSMVEPTGMSLEAGLMYQGADAVNLKSQLLEALGPAMAKADTLIPSRER